MEIDSSLVGEALPSIERVVEWRDTMNYAASVGDANPRYLDDTRKGGVIAPPLFAVAVTWPMMDKLRDYFQDRIAPEVVMTMVHATEHLIFHRPVRPGAHLLITGKVAAILPQRAGTLMVLELSASDDRGERFFTEYAGAMFRGVDCADAGRGGDGIPVLPDLSYPDEAKWESEISISPSATYVYDGCTDIVFPIHTSEGFARMVGLPGIILQGTATLALAAREIVNRECAGDPERLKEIACRFSGMVRPGSAIRLQVFELQDNDARMFTVLNAEDKAALKSGYALIEENDE